MHNASQSPFNTKCAKRHTHAIVLTNSEQNHNFPSSLVFTALFPRLFRGHSPFHAAREYSSEADIYMYKPDKNGGVKMFIKTIKVKKPNLLAAAMLAGIICLLTIVALTAFKFAKKGSYTLENEQQRQEFLKEMGWEVGAEFDECRQILIPEEFNDVYNSYNDLQKQQGFDLSAYKGKSCNIYTYKVSNYKDHEEKDDVVCHLMICDNKLIGGDVCSVELDGFMQGLKNTDAD